jgi:hypothetical protein
MHQKISLDKLLTQVKETTQSPSQILGLEEADFKKLTFEELLNNQDDINNGVSSVSELRGLFFDLFQLISIKEFDSGNKTFSFYASTLDFTKINSIFNEIKSVFGKGLCDPGSSECFDNIVKLIHYCTTNPPIRSRLFLHLWTLPSKTVSLAYRPNHILILSITEKQVVEIDKSIRRNGTILDLLKFNLNYLLDHKEKYCIEDAIDEHSNAPTLTFKLTDKEFDYFDRLKYRILLSSKGSSTITLYSSCPSDFKAKIRIVETLIKKFGCDSDGNSDLQFYEMEIIEKGDFWTGRKWIFNQHHGLYDRDKKDEMPFWVDICDYQDDEGFNLSIVGFNKLLELFSP